MPVQLKWLNENTFRINHARYYLTYDPEELATLSSTNEQFVLGKPQLMISNLLSLTSRMEVSNIFEMGIFKGGSTALYAELFNPRKLVAIEYDRERVSALDHFIEEAAMTDRVKPYYGVDQADREQMHSILVTEFPDQDVDLVVDDASHYYEETKASFNYAFPFLRPGGLYVIEDWAWAHWAGELWQMDGGIWRDRLALTNLVVEILMLCSSHPELIDDVVINRDTMFVRRSYMKMEQEGFDISAHYLMRGKDFKPCI